MGDNDLHSARIHEKTVVEPNASINVDKKRGADGAAVRADAPSQEFVKPQEAVELYQNLCQKLSLFANSTFVTQVRSNTVCFAFDDNYLGPNGIVAIIKTLVRLPLQELSLRRCALTTGDIALIADAFAGHTTLEKIDLRDNAVTLSAAKKLLLLLTRNRCLQHILVDPSTPRFAALQRQSLTNADVLTKFTLCLVCGGPVTETLNRRVEILLFEIIGGCFDDAETTVDAVVVEMLFRLIMCCVDASDGAICVCSEVCAEALAYDVFICAFTGTRAFSNTFSRNVAKLPLLHTTSCDLIAEIRARAHVSQSNADNSLDACRANPLDTFLDKLNDTKLKEAEGAHEQQCSVCGAVLLDPPSNGAELLLRRLLTDVHRGATLTPSALPRVCRVMIAHAADKPCSSHCVRAVVRFGLYGYGGVIRSRKTTEPLLSSTGADLQLLPTADFTVTDISRAFVECLQEEELTCALTVASMMEDMDGIPSDPYMIFALGRYLRAQPPRSLGMELHAACEAVHRVGCLASACAPFDRRSQNNRPPRDQVAQWSSWCALRGLQRYLRAALARRRLNLFSVDGPHGDLFDNTRAALWAFRRQRRTVAVVLKCSLAWLAAEGGVIPDNCTPKGGFYTTVKVVGQRTIQNTQHLVIQGNFGPHCGHGGFFYIPKTLFNCYADGNAYVFVDPTMYSADVGAAVVACVTPWISPRVAGLATHYKKLVDLVRLVCSPLSPLAGLTDGELGVLRAAKARVPPGLLEHFGSARDVRGRPPQWVRRLLTTCMARGPQYTQLLFAISEVMNDEQHCFLNDVLLPLADRIPSGAWVRMRRAARHATSAQLNAPSYSVPSLSDKTRKGPSSVGHESVSQVPVEASASPCVVAGAGGAGAAKHYTEIVQRDVGGPQAPQAKSFKRKPSTTTKGRRKSSAQEPLEQPSSAVKDEVYDLYQKLWSDERESLRLQVAGSSPQHAPQNVASCRRALSTPLLHGSEDANSSGPQDVDPALPYNFIGKQWKCMHVTTQGGELSRYAVFFIEDSVCVMDVCTGQLQRPLESIAECDAVLHSFPFAKGFDCVLHHPLRPQKAYFFSGAEWMCWDCHYQVCLGGPYSLRSHLCFKGLPEELLCGIHRALAVPHTPLVLLFTKESYVVFDMSRHQPVTALMSLKATPLPQAAVRRRDYGGPLPILSEDFLQRFVGGPMTSMWACVFEAPADNTEKTEAKDAVARGLLVIGDDGDRELVDFAEGATKSSETSQQDRLTNVEEAFSRLLANLPVAFRQMTVEALPVICASLVGSRFASSVSSGGNGQRAMRVEPLTTSAFIGKPADTPNLGENTPHHNVVVDSASDADAQRITTSLVPTEAFRKSIVALIAPSCADATKDARSTLLRSEVCLWGHNGQLHSAPKRALEGTQDFVQFDLGNGSREAFGALVVVLDTYHASEMYLRQHPMQLVVESSSDHVVYVHCASASIASRTNVCFLEWSESHPRRYWRIRFKTALPDNVGLTRVFWFRAQWSPHAEPMPLLETYMPSAGSVAVDITAERTLQVPEELLDILNTAPVFSTASADGWLQTHAVLPLLDKSPLCLFFYGDYVVEYNMARSEVVSRCAVHLTDHPFFRNLPYPFSRGFRTIFYADPEECSSDVVIVKGGQLLRWDLKIARALAPPHAACDSELFSALPVDLNAVRLIFNIWTQPSCVCVAYTSGSSTCEHEPELHVLEWSCRTRSAVRGPVALDAYPSLFCSEFAGKPLLCAFSPPTDPSRVFICCEDMVTATWREFAEDGDSARPHQETYRRSTPPTPVRQSPFFFPMTRYFDLWGTPTRECSVFVDFREAAPLVLGVEMICTAAPHNMQWVVEYSEDALSWEAVDVHCQTQLSARTTWLPSAVHNKSHRYWRLSVLHSPTGGAVVPSPLSYSSLHFLVLPQRPLHVAPASRYLVAGAARGKDGAELGAGGTEDAVMLDRSPKQSSLATCEGQDGGVDAHGSSGAAYHATLDFDVHQPKLTGFCFTCHPASACDSQDTWVVLCSRDAAEWTLCGAWRALHATMHLAWMPHGPFRFWRLELLSSRPSPALHDFRCFEYNGPVLTLCDGRCNRRSETESSIATALRLLLPLSVPGRAGLQKYPTCVFFNADAENSVVVKPTVCTTTPVGVALQYINNNPSDVEFAVEFSDDGSHWFGVATLVCPLQSSGERRSEWSCVGDHEWWRLRVASPSSGSVQLQHLCFMTTRTSLYTSCIPQSWRNTAAEDRADCVYLGLAQPRRVVRVVATLPADSVYAVEKLSECGIGWDPVATAMNASATRAARVGTTWDLTVGSTSWRLRYCGAVLAPGAVTDGERVGVACAPSAVEWSCFHALMPYPVDMQSIMDKKVVTTGFTELLPVDYLSMTKSQREGSSSTPVLRTNRRPDSVSVSDSTDLTLTWCFRHAAQLAAVFIDGVITGVAQRGGISFTGTIPHADDAPAEVSVEISNNGTDFTPVAAASFTSEGAVLEWTRPVGALAWRIKFNSVSPRASLELHRVEWRYLREVPQATKMHSACSYSNLLHAAWQAEVFSDEANFCARCRLGYDQAKSHAAKLRDEGDLDRVGEVAKRIWKMERKYHAFISKLSKESARGVEPPTGPYFSPKANLSTDIMYFLLKSSERYSCGFDELIGVIEQPMSIATDFTYVKGGTTWFYPRFEVRGVLSDDFYGFPKLHASFSVLWSLSTELQRNGDLLTHPAVHELSPHVASPLVVIHIHQSQWRAADRFADLPLLYHAGFSGRPMVMAVVLNEISFNDKYPLPVPGGGPLPAPFSYKLLPGINFVLSMPVANCPSPAFDQLRLLYSEELLSTRATVIVFSAANVHSRSSATVSFTLPAADVNFGVENLFVEALEFEVHLDEEVRGQSSTPDTALHKSGACTLCFVTHGARFLQRSGKQEQWIPISLAGGFAPDDRGVIHMHGACSPALPSSLLSMCGARVERCTLDATLTTAGGTPRRFRPYHMSLTAQLRLASGHNATCSAPLTRPITCDVGDEVELVVPEMPLSAFIRLALHFIRGGSDVRSGASHDLDPRACASWTEDLPITLSCSLRLQAGARKVARGAATLRFFSQVVPHAAVYMDVHGFGVKATAPALSIGDIELGSIGSAANANAEGVAISILGSSSKSLAQPATNSGVGVRIRVEGVGRLLSTDSIPMCVVIAEDGVWYSASAKALVFSAKFNEVFGAPVLSTVTLNKDAVLRHVERYLHDAPLVAALLANGLPFYFTPQTLQATASVAREGRLTVNLCGVFFSCWFDVSEVIMAPVNSDEGIRVIGEQMASSIIEQSGMALCTAYNVVAGWSKTKREDAQITAATHDHS